MQTETRLDVLARVGVIMIALLTVALASCASLPSPGQPEQTEGLPPTISLAPTEEPGQRLTIYGTVVEADTAKPVPHARLYLYHADANGEYRPVDPEDESTAALSGEVTADERGRFIVKTIVPREYDQPGNRHIHLHYVRADGYQETGGVILFEQDVNAEIRAWANETGFGIILELAEREGGLEGDLMIALDPEEG